MNASALAKQLTQGDTRGCTVAYRFWCKCECAVQPIQERWLLEILLESGQEGVFQERKHAVPGKMWYHYKLNTAYIFNICLKIKTLRLFLIHHLKHKIQLNPTTFSIYSFSIYWKRWGIVQKTACGKISYLQEKDRNIVKGCLTRISQSSAESGSTSTCWQEETWEQGSRNTWQKATPVQNS